MNGFGICVFILLVAGCGKPVPTAETPQQEPKGPTSCLVRYRERPETLLSSAHVAELLGIQESDLRRISEEGSVSWTWPGDRVRRIEVGDQVLETPSENQIHLSPLRVLPEAEAEDWLSKHYQALSDTDRERLTAEQKERWQDRVARGLSTEEEARVAGETGHQERLRRREVEEIGTLADGARWVVHGQTLVTRHRNVIVTLYVDASEEASENRAVAIALTRLILNVCDS